jgi:hypothetical protein
MKKSVSSLLAEARELRKRVMPSRSVVRKVKFTPEEMAFEPLPDYSHLKFKRRKGVRNLVELEPDLAAFYRSSDAVNNALRKVMEALPNELRKRKKSA